MTIPVPDSLRPKADDIKFGIKPPGRSNVGDGYYGHFGMDDIRALDNPRAREIVTDYNRWLQSENNSMERSGFNAAERDFDVIDKQIDRIGQAISTTLAHTVDGMKVKARVVYCYMLAEIDQEGSYDATSSILRDLMRLQGQESISPSEYKARYQRTPSKTLALKSAIRSAMQKWKARSPLHDRINAAAIGGGFGRPFSERDRCLRVGAGPFLRCGAALSFREVDRIQKTDQIVSRAVARSFLTYTTNPSRP
jgi:hypothetical protein